ncbi:MAG TPA: BtrH N-terminal domain-containing protein [Spirochaetota bacterium]|nr:BtrH N-terminal domain-containing protein [Spirochaetota bacterium]HRZ26487.1 BtrH N-terminal domain-containing protein [Spirochaetota bacterium]HSA15571.1 BtrH N-terminal domain-containing protein [Spirochaetota bacterium]
MNTKTIHADYIHYQGGHCESASVSSLVKNHGFELSEPMAFGISSNIGFAFLPFVKVWGKPLIAYRMFPQTIIKGVQKRMGIVFCRKTYNDQQEAMNELDRLLSLGVPVGLQVSVAYLPYFLGEFQVPFNGHMTIIYGKDGDEYLVSDPIYDHTTRISRNDLQKARFAQGPNEPRGFIFYPEHVPETVDYRKAIQKAVRRSATMMLQPMFPYYGILGIKSFARAVRRLQHKNDKRYVRTFLSNIFLFQEEIGTGGGGFRYMYAAFLREAYNLLNIPELLEASKKMIEAGDAWRRAAALSARFIQKREDSPDFENMANMYLQCARVEKEIYVMLKKIKWK